MTVQYLPDNRYIPLQGVQTLFNDKLTSQALVGGYLKFYTDTSTSTPKDVYILTQSPGPIYTFTNIGSTVTLGTAGSPTVNNTDVQVYLYPYDLTTGAIQLYYMEVYSVDNVLQLTRQALPSNVQGSQGIENFQGSDNQIENSQFVVTNLPSSLTQAFAVTGTGTVTQVAPDWSIVTNGSGTVTITQVPLQITNMPTGAPFALEISNTDAGITSLKLRQTITESPRIFFNGSTAAYAYGSLVAKTYTGAAALLTMDYVPSTGSIINLVSGSTSADGNYNTIANTSASLITSTNTDSPLTPGYVNIDITIPAGAHVGITSVQVVSVESENSTTPYIQESVSRQIDHLFHYYNQPLQFKPIPSLLVGWDFPLNPAQFGSSATISTTPSYIWDQTICASATANVNVVRGTNPKGAFVATTTGNTEAFYMMQYLDSPQAVETALSNLAVNFNGYASASGVTIKVYLFNGNASSTIPTLPTTIGTIANTGVFTKTAANWTAIPQTGGGYNSSTLSVNAVTDIGFAGFNPLAYYGLTNNFAIVVTFAVPVSGTVVVVNSISCVPGDIPTRPAPQTVDEVLRECEYYYEYSYTGGETVPTVDGQNAMLVYQNAIIASTNVVMLTTPFNLQWKIPKRVTPLFNLYSPVSGSGDTVNGAVYTNGIVRNSGDISLSGNWSTAAGPTGIGTKNMHFVPSNGTAQLSTAYISTTNPFGFLTFHYYADARLGMV